jgi:hypothetical protein
MKKSFLTLLLLFSIYFSSCDLFTTRDPETPEKSRDNYQIATSPDELLANLQNSLKDKLVENYLTCFSKSHFRFSPSAGSMLNYPSLQSWDLKSEEQYFKNMLNLIDANSVIELDLSNPEFNRTTDSVFYSSNYSLTVPFTDNQRPKKYAGILHFTMVQDSSLAWIITNWQDVNDQNLPAWSELKGRLY